MRFDRKGIMVLTLLLGATMGAQCITVNEDPTVWVNAEDITGVYNITPTATVFAAPNDCVTKQPSDYLDQDFGLVVGGQLVDIKYQAFGTFAGNINGGSVSVNGTQIISYSGPWSTWTTQRSLLTGDHLNPNPAGVTVLVNAIKNNQPVTICVGGSFSQPAPAGLSVQVDVVVQVAVEPD